MRRFEIYVTECNLVEMVLNDISNSCPCFIDKEPVEMNCTHIIITCREEDASTVEVRLTAMMLLC